MFNSVKEAQAIIENYIRQTRNTQGFEPELGFGRKRFGTSSRSNLKRIKLKTIVLLTSVFILIAILSAVSLMIIKSVLYGL